MRDDFRQAYRSFVHPLGRGSNRSVASDDMGWNARARIWNRHIVYLSADLNPLYLEGFKMTKTEDQIIAEAVRLTEADVRWTSRSDAYVASVARHALRLATQPEQDPALVKAMAVWDEAREAWEQNDFNHETAALKIMDAYPAPPQTAVEWAKQKPLNTFPHDLDGLRDYILTMAGEKQ